MEFFINRLLTTNHSNNNSEQYSNARSLLASTFYLPSEEVAISAANYNYNHYNLPFSDIMIIVIISDEDMLDVETPVVERVNRSEKKASNKLFVENIN